MPRLEVELTSARADGTWTWRKAGARQPKGELEGTLLPSEAKVGDVIRVEADALIDGIEITSVLPLKAEKKDRYERIEIKGRPAPDQLVSTTLAPKRDKRKGRDGDRRPDRRDRGEHGDRSERGERRERGGRSERGPRPRPAELELPERPKPKRLRPGRTHRSEVLSSLPPEQQRIAEQVLAGGVPAVRQAVEQQNATNREAGLPEVKGDELVALAEQLLPALRAAEWRDRAEGAMAIVDEIDLRDLRSVVVAADTVRGEDTRELEASLREALNRRVEQEHEAWLEELRLTLAADRAVRALRLSSRPPKAGAPLPPDLAEKLSAAAAASMTADTSIDRWVTVLDALSVSPVRNSVSPQSIPDPVPEKLKEAVTAVAAKLPHIAERFGIDPKTVKAPSRRRRPAPPPPTAKKAAPKPTPDANAEPMPEAATEPPVETAVIEPPTEPMPEPPIETAAIEPVPEPSSVEEEADEGEAEPEADDRDHRGSVEEEADEGRPPRSRVDEARRASRSEATEASRKPSRRATTETIEDQRNCRRRTGRAPFWALAITLSRLRASAPSMDATRARSLFTFRLGTFRASASRASASTMAVPFRSRRDPSLVLAR
jgi:hypothetical protein